VTRPELITDASKQIEPDEVGYRHTNAMSLGGAHPAGRRGAESSDLDDRGLWHTGGRPARPDGPADDDAGAAASDERPSGARPGRRPRGGSGAGIYADGDRFTVHVAGSVIEDNHANEGGGAIFFVSNDRTGTLAIDGSTLRRNRSDGFETEGFPGIFFLGAGQPAAQGSTLD
jgi:hypothetical protein